MASYKRKCAELEAQLSVYRGAKRYEIHPGISVVVHVEGNWMMLPTEKLKEIFKAADIFESLATRTPPQEGQ